MKKYVLLTFILLTSLMLVATSVFTGCKTTEAAEEAVEEVEEAAEEAVEEVEETTEEVEEEEAVPVSLTFWVLSGTTTDTLAAIIENFSEEYPSINIRIETQEWSNLMNIYKSAIASGKEDMDFLWAQGGRAMSGDIMNDDMLVDLTPYYEEKGWEKIFPETSKDYRANGKYYFFPTDWITIAMLYFNPEIFNEVGAEIPTSVEELYSMSDKLHNAGYETLAIGDRDKWALPYIFNAILTRMMSAEDYKELIYGSYPGGSDAVKWDDSRVIKAASFLKELYDNEFFAPGILSMNYGEAQTLFTTRKAAMFTHLQNGATYIHQDAPDLTLDYFLFPQIESDIPIVSLVEPVNGIIVPKYTAESPEKLDAIITFLDYVVREESMLEYAKNGLMPIRTDIPVEELAAVLEPTSVKAIEDINKYGSVGIFEGWLDPEINDLLGTKVVEVMVGDITAEQFGQDMEEKTAEIRSQ